MTEVDAQNAIWDRYVGKNLMICPCSFVLGWEADMLVVTRALLCHEFEIKLERGDFLSDKKKDKFKDFDRWFAGQKTYRVKGYYHEWEANTLRPANYFWYVSPPDIITPEDVPEWAGLAHIVPDQYQSYTMDVQKKPTKLHGEHLSIEQLRQLCGSMNGRYWDLRMNLKREDEMRKGRG